jgi:hypothetical protein
VSTGPGDLHNRPREEIAHDIAEFKADLAFERESLD